MMIVEEAVVERRPSAAGSHMDRVESSIGFGCEGKLAVDWIVVVVVGLVERYSGIYMGAMVW